MMINTNYAIRPETASLKKMSGHKSTEGKKLDLQFHAQRLSIKEHTAMIT